MTRQLRQHHRRTILVLAVIVSLVFVFGLLVRRPVPVMSGVVDLPAPRPPHPATR